MTFGPIDNLGLKYLLLFATSKIFVHKLPKEPILAGFFLRQGVENIQGGPKISHYQQSSSNGIKNRQ